MLMFTSRAAARASRSFAPRVVHCRLPGRGPARVLGIALCCLVGTCSSSKRADTTEPRGGLAEQLVGSWSGSVLAIDFPTGKIVEVPGLEVDFYDDGTWSSNYEDVATDSMEANFFFYEGQWRAVGDRAVFVSVLCQRTAQCSYDHTSNVLIVSKNEEEMLLAPLQAWMGSWVLYERREFDK